MMDLDRFCQWGGLFFEKRYKLLSLINDLIGVINANDQSIDPKAA